MTKIAYLLAGVLAGSSAKMLMENMEQAKTDRCRKVSKDTKIPLEQVVAIADMDPTASGSYIDWLARIASKGELPPKEEVVQTLSRFDKLKKLPDFSSDKNVLSYKTWGDLSQVVGAAHAVSSKAEKDRQVRTFSKYVHKRHPYVDKEGLPLIVGGYPQWVERLVKTGDVILPEDADQLLELIDAFEEKKKDPNFLKSKNIMTYRTRAQLNHALFGDEVPETKENYGYEAIQDGPGIKKIDSTSANGHYYDLYAVTTPEMAALHFAKSNFPLDKNGWCVKSPNFFRDYRLGPKNPAYFFRKDGIPYALTDVGSQSVKDQNDANATPDLIFELLQLDMPNDVKENILNIHPWTKKYKKAIMSGGSNAAVVAAFEEASNASKITTKDGQRLSYAEQWKIAMDSAIQFMRYFGWAYPPTEAMEYVTKNPVIAMAYSVFVEKARIPELEPLILSHPRAASAYYDYLNKGATVRDDNNKADPTKVLVTVPGGQFENHKWPEFFDKIQSFLEQREHLPFWVYMANSGQVIPEDKTFTYTVPGQKPQTMTWGQLLNTGAPWARNRDTTLLKQRYQLAVETNGDYINQTP